MASTTQMERIRIEAAGAAMDGMLVLPDCCIGMVLFVNCGGSSRVAHPSDYVASVLRGAKLGTLWLDLLTQEEAGTPRNRQDIALLTARLNAACDWMGGSDVTADLPLGLYGASNAAAAALQVAARRDGIAAIVCRSGRTDLADSAELPHITAATLLIVGGLDEAVLRLNRQAYLALRCKKRLEIVPGATHSFEEPGNFEVVARLARSWFLQYSQSAYV